MPLSLQISSAMAILLYHKHRHHRLLLGVGPAVDNGTTPSRPWSTETNLDTNMVIILAALLCALVCVLGLNSIIRCALRYGRRDPEAPEQAAARSAPTGLKKRVLRRIPVAVYRTADRASGATECPICLAELVDCDKVRVLPTCKHEFHVKCIDSWLTSHSSCPTCRCSLLDWTVAVAVAESAADAELVRSSLDSVAGGQPAITASERI